MNARCIAAVFALTPLVASEAGAATDVTPMYDAATLEQWGARYERSTRRIFEEIIWPALLTDEKQRLGAKPTIEFPRYAEGEGRRHPLMFYVPANRAVIVMPVFSLKFLDDLCTAFAWLHRRGYDIETVAEYCAILRHREAPPGGFPAPLPALGIPANALEDRAVDDLALQHFVTARTWLLSHELGHLLHRHVRRSFAESVRNEQEADAFAARAMARTPLPPIGIIMFFLADAHWSQFPAEGRNTHPLTGDRVRALAQLMPTPEMRMYFDLIGRSLDDPEIRDGFVATGKAGDLGALAPRRVGELPRRHQAPAAVSPTARFAGTYRGKFVQFPEPRAMELELVLERQGDRVSGTFTFGLGTGTVKGIVDGARLVLEWQWATSYGRAVLQERSDGSLAGTLGYRETNTGAGTWSELRRR